MKTGIILPVMFMLNTRGEEHQKSYGQDAIYDLGLEDTVDMKRFIPNSICCVITYAKDDKPITDPKKTIDFCFWTHQDTEVNDLIIYRGKFLNCYSIARNEAQSDGLLSQVFNTNGDFKQFKILPSSIPG
jgi:hypothetical protein